MRKRKGSQNFIIKLNFCRDKKPDRKKARRDKKNKEKRISNYHQDRTNIKKDVAHKITYTLVRDERIKVYVLENLKLRNMTKKVTAGTVDKPGKMLKQNLD